MILFYFLLFSSTRSPANTEAETNSCTLIQFVRIKDTINNVFSRWIPRDRRSGRAHRRSPFFLMDAQRPSYITYHNRVIDVTDHFSSKHKSCCIREGELKETKGIRETRPCVYQQCGRPSNTVFTYYADRKLLPLGLNCEPSGLVVSSQLYKFLFGATNESKRGKGVRGRKQRQRAKDENVPISPKGRRSPFRFLLPLG